MKKTSILIAGIAAIILFASVDMARAEVFERGGIVADRDAQSVVISATATGVEPGNPVEFILINSKSGHDYEALVATDAKASDIKAALEYIGLKPGRTVNEGKLRFWPRGARLDVAIRRLESKHSDNDPVSVAQYLFDVRSQSVPQPFPFTFAGSLVIKNSTNSQICALAADVAEPRSIISTYNEEATLIDLSRQAPKGSEYGKTLPNPEKIMESGEKIKIVITPHSPANNEVDVRLIVKGGPDGAVRECRIINTDRELLNDSRTLPGAVAHFAAMVDDGLIPFVVVELDGSLSVASVRNVCTLISSIDTIRGIRVEPPASGSLYYKAFLPEPVMADRDKRGLQPPELHLSIVDGKLLGKLVKARRSWSEQEPGKSSIVLESWRLTDPSDFAKRVKLIAAGMPILIVAADDQLPLHSLMAYVRPVLDEYPRVFVMPSQWFGE